MSSASFDYDAAIHPDQIVLIQKVFDDLARETWLDDTDENREGLAALILHVFRRGKIRESDLLEASHELARERFRR